MCSYRDKYEKSGNCLIYDLFNSNKLEYVKISCDDPNSESVGSILIPGNFQDLRYLEVEMKYSGYLYGYLEASKRKISYEIKLNVKEKAP